MSQLKSEYDNLAACYLFILERMRARRLKQQNSQSAGGSADQAGSVLPGTSAETGVSGGQDHLI